jgi:hypothetical protein
MQFLEKPIAPVSVAPSKKKNFENFTEQDLRYLLDSVKQMALAELAAGGNRAAVIAHYDEMRVGIVEELHRRDSKVPVDFEKME